jgi:hypothetical protein
MRRTVKSNRSKAGAALLLLPFAIACGQSATSDLTDAGGTPRTPPIVVSSTPPSGATGIPLNASASATFDQEMDRATISATTFTLTSGGPPVQVQGTVIYDNTTAVFWPAALLASNKTYTATISTGAKSSFSLPLATSYAWTFTTGNTKAPGIPVNLGTAGSFVILAKSRISTVPTSAITGDLGVSPAAASYITGFGLTADATNAFSTSPQVSGKVYAADYAQPTPTKMTTAIGDMELAFTDAAARAPDVTELGAGNIGGRTLIPGVYKWSSGLLIPADVTLSGSATDVWIFQIAQDLTMSSATKIILSGGALPKNVFWQVAGAVTLGTGAHCEGVILTQTSATLRTGASIKGRLLAQTAVTIDGSTVVAPLP